MTWSLYIDTYRSNLVVLNAEVFPPGSQIGHYVLISTRDPDQPLVFRQGGYYFNPLFKEGGQLHPYIVNGDGNLASIYTGKPPKKFSREKTALYDRGWFELEPRPISPADIPPDLGSLIEHQPRLHGAIAQVARSSMNLKIPEGLDIKTAEGWHAWLAGQRMAITPRLGTIFRMVQSRPQVLTFSDRDFQHFLTGEMPEPLVRIKLRWYTYETVKIIRKRLKESAEWEISVPASVVKEGEAAIVAAADIALGSRWKELSTNLGITDQDSPEEPDETIEGPLVWIRPEGEAEVPYTPFGPKFEGGKPTTISDLFQIAIQSS